MEFYFPVSTTRSPVGLIPKCDACKLLDHCNSPKMPIDGKGQKKILIVSDYPGSAEDDANKPLVGASGQEFEDRCEQFGVRLRRDCWIMNALSCYPGERDVNKRRVEYCRPIVTRAIRELDPNVIILMGTWAVRSVIGAYWKEDVGKIGRWTGWRIPLQKPNVWICILNNPAHLLYTDKDPKGKVINYWFNKHLKEALSLKEKPWEGTPDKLFGQKILRVWSEKEAISYIEQVIESKLPFAFDYETTTLKPDSKGAEIVSVSISNGEITFAYPFTGNVVRATKHLIKSDNEKVGTNIKFEERWSRRILKCRVKNWRRDTMLDAHVLDNRAGITSIKFQAFVQLGVPSWDDKIKPFLKARKGTEVNRIKEIDLNDLLMYNGLDSLYELLVAKKQSEALGLALGGTM